MIFWPWQLIRKFQVYSLALIRFCTFRNISLGE